MLKQFVSGSGVFALSVLVFSFIRQIMVFPALSRYSDSLFVEMTFMIFTFEAVAYGFTGAIPDYYVRQVRGEAADSILLRRLARLCLASFVCFVPFLLLGFGVWASLLLTVYLYCFALNALKMKVIFNKLNFQENFVYMASRAVPYPLILAMVHLDLPLLAGWELAVAAGMLLAFEALYLVRLNAITRRDLARPETPADSRDGGLLYRTILPFIVSCLLMGLIQRGDLTFVKLADVDYYVGYAKLILTVNFFCAPLALMVSSPFLSFLSRYDLSLASKEARHILLAIVGMAVITGIGAVIVFRPVYSLLYGGAYAGSGWLVFYFTVATLLYAVARTLVVRFVAVRLALSVNIMLVLLTTAMAVLASVQWAVVVFYASRLASYFGMLIIHSLANKRTKGLM